MGAPTITNGPHGSRQNLLIGPGLLKAPIRLQGDHDRLVVLAGPKAGPAVAIRTDRAAVTIDLRVTIPHPRIAPQHLMVLILLRADPAQAPEQVGLRVIRVLAKPIDRAAALNALGGIRPDPQIGPLNQVALIRVQGVIRLLAEPPKAPPGQVLLDHRNDHQMIVNIQPLSENRAFANHNNKKNGLVRGRSFYDLMSIISLTTGLIASITCSWVMPLTLKVTTLSVGFSFVN